MDLTAMILFVVLFIIASCLPDLAAAKATPNNDGTQTKRILNRILTSSSHNLTEISSHLVTQHITCGRKTEVKTFGIYPTEGSETGGTPVAVALQINAIGETSNGIEMHDKNDFSMLRCKFGDAYRPVLQGPAMEIQLARLVSASASPSPSNSFTHTSSGDNFQLFVCLAPPYAVSGEAPGPLPFSISCDNQEEETTQDSTLDFEFTIASSVHSISPSLGGPGTNATVKGSGFRNSPSLACFFGQQGVVKGDFVSSDTVICTAPDQADGHYPVVISNNGIDSEGERDSPTFAYVPLPVVNGVEPQAITLGINGEANVNGLVVNGQYFAHTAAIVLCSFGEGVTSLAVVESDDGILCPVPTFQDLAKQSSFISNVRVSTNGGIDFSTSSARAFFYQPVVLHSALPNTAPEMGSIISIHGENFHPSNSLACWFHLDGDDGHLSVPAKYVSSSNIRCHTPQSKIGSAQLWVSTNDNESGRSLNSLGFKFLGAMSLTSSSPLMGSLAGGTSVTIIGGGFGDEFSTVCRFGVALVAAMVLNTTCLHCISPPALTALGGNSFELWSQSHGSIEDNAVSIDVSTNGGHDFTASGFTFQYTSDQFVLESMSPNIGPQGGSTTITFFGQGIGNYEAVKNDAGCEFSIVGLEYKLPLTPIRVVDEDSLSCTSPSISSLLRTMELSRMISVISAHVKIIAQNGNEVATGMSTAIFSFYPEVTLSKLYPLGGSELGGTEVEIQGSNFVQTAGLRCLFNGIASPSVKWISSSHIVCEAPEAAFRSPRASQANFTLAINDGEKLTSDELQFFYLPVSHIVSFNPLFGSVDGGTSIHIHGSGFELIEGIPPQCLFAGSNLSTIATLLSRALIQCSIPPAQLANKTTVALSFNGGADVVSADRAFTYISPATIDSAFPNYISSSGGAKVTIRGNNFMPEKNLSGSLRCSFDDTVVTATAINTETVVCFAPPMEPGPVEVRVTMNGVDFTTNGANVVYHLPTEIHEAIPPFALETGGETVVVEGANFQPSIGLSCIFSSSPGTVQITVAKFDSQSRITCIVPPSNIGMAASTLEISNSKEANTDNPSFPFQYYQLISIISVKQGVGQSGEREAVLEAIGIHLSQVDLVCGFTLMGNEETRPYSTAKVRVMSSREIRCAPLPAFAYDHKANIFSITVGIIYNGVFHSLTAPQSEPVLFFHDAMIETATVNSTEALNSAKIDKSISIESVEPTIVSEFGGSIISMVSLDLELRGKNISCIFSTPDTSSGLTSRNPAYVVTKQSTYKNKQQFDSNLLTCEAPRMTPGEYLLSLELTDTPLEASVKPVIALLTVHRAFSLSGFEPLSGPTSGGTNMTVHGSSFPNTTELSCKVGNSITKAKFISQEKIVCLTPKIDKNTVSILSSVHISVSANGQDFEEINGMMFSYTLRPHVVEAFPMAGAATGGTALTIRGTNLIPKDAARGVIVSFDNEVIVTGIPLNETAVSCITPPLEKEGMSSIVSIRVSTNGGHDFSHSKISFSFHKLSISHVKPSYGPEIGGNAVTIVGSGFTTGDFEDGKAACRFGDIIVPMQASSEMNCIAPKSIAHSSVNVAATANGIDWTSSHAYMYLPMLQIHELKTPTLPTNVPHTITLIGEFFHHQSEFQLMCKLGSTISSKAVIISDSLLICFIPPMRHPGEVTLDIVTEGGDSMLERISDTTIKFYDPINFRIAPSFGNINGGTVVTAFLDSAFSLGVDLMRVGSQLMCRFSMDSGIIDVMAMPLNESAATCATPNVTTFWLTDDDYIHATVSLVSMSGDLILPVSLSFPFMFKPVPDVKSIVPRVGSSEGGTQVRIIGEGPGEWPNSRKHVFWLNSSLLTCYFGEEEVEAIWIAPLVVSCTSPASQNVSEAIITVSDNGVDLGGNVINEPTFYFHPDPHVTSIEPRIVVAPNNNTVTLFGNGFSGRDTPICIFHALQGNDTIHVEGTVINDTAMECNVASGLLPPSEYVCKASNNAGIEWGSSEDAVFISIRPPNIDSLTPQSGIEGEEISVAVSGNNLAVEGLHHTLCVLFDHSGVSIGSSLAERVNGTSLVRCPVQCPSHNATVKYFLGISLGDAAQVHSSSMHTFWCDPRPSILDWMPKFISVGGLTPIRVNMGEFRPANPVDCIFTGNGQIAKVHAQHVTGGVIECLAPTFDHPQTVSLGVSLNNHTLADELQIGVVDLLLIDSIFPDEIFGGSVIVIKGSNFDPEKMNCKIAGTLATVIRNESNETDLACRSSAYADHNSAAQVSISFNDAPQLNAMSDAVVEIHPAPRVDRISPSSGLVHGGTQVIIQGVNFHAIGRPLCYFGDIAVTALSSLTETSISCLTPENEEGKVTFQLSLDNGRTFHGDQYFSFFTPIILQDMHPRVVINGTTVILRGVGFHRNLPIYCAIGGHSFAPATVLSPTEAACMFAPTSESFGRLSVSIVTANHIPASFWTVPDTSVIHHPLVEISPASNLVGPASGGETVELRVSGALNDDVIEMLGLIHCQFGMKVTLATMLDDSVISCEVPVAEFTPGKVSLSLLYDGLLFSVNQLIFDYVTKPVIQGINPILGTYSGGTLVKVHGLNLMPRSQVMCRFGHHESYGYFDTGENSVFCITPAINYTTSQTIYLKLDPAMAWLDTGIDFNFVEPIIIKSSSPLEIASGVEYVRVKGQGFLRGSDLLCRFGEERYHATTEAIVLSNTTIKCPLPWESLKDLKQIPLSVTSNNRDFVWSASILTRVGEGEVSTRRLSPVLGPAFGSSMIDIYGVGFQENNATITCWFGGVASRAIYLADGHIQCLSVPVFIKESEQIALRSVSVSQGHDMNTAPNLRDNTVNFTYFSHPSNLDIQPIHGVSTGGTKVTIRNAKLADVLRTLYVLGVQLEPMCQFDTIAVPATIEFEEGEIMVCAAPPMQTESNSTKGVPVSVSLNGQDFVYTQQNFHYYHPQSIDSITPEIVWIEESTEIVIHGSHFIPLDGTACIFGDVAIKAEVVSNSEIRCHVYLNQTYSNQILPVRVSLNGVDVSNAIPVICRVNIPMVTSMSPLFVSDSGGSMVKLKGHGFDQIRKDGLVKLKGRVKELCVMVDVIDDETASFVVPSSNIQASASIWISFVSSPDAFAYTGFELQYLPHLHITEVKPPFVLVGRETRVKISGSFQRSWSYSCILFEDDINNPALEVMADYKNEVTLVCDIVLSTALNLALRRREDNQTSNYLNIFSTPHYVLDTLEPSIISEAEANAGGQMLHITSPGEFMFNRHDLLHCRFIDEIGTISMTNADIISENEIRCASPLLTGNTELSLAKDDILQSNVLSLDIHPTSQILQLTPDLGPSSGGTHIKILGAGFAAYSHTNALCKFGDESSTANIIDDETIHCRAPANGFDGTVKFALSQASSHGLSTISNTDMIYSYYAQPELVACTPDNGPSSGGAEVELEMANPRLFGNSSFDEADFCETFMVSFSSLSDPTRVAYSKQVKLLSESILSVQTPPSPTGSKGGMVTIQASLNGQDFSRGLYYTYTESAFIQSFYPRQVMGRSCFDLTLLAENMLSSPTQCSIGGVIFPAIQGLISGTATCEVCLDLHEGYHQVGLLTNNNVFTQASVELEVRRPIDVVEMTPSMGPLDSETVVFVTGQDFEAWDEGQLYCFFGDNPSLATVLNDTVLQCTAPMPAKDSLFTLPVRVSPHQQYSMKKDNSTLLYKYYKAESIDSFEPRSGPENGGTTVQIIGSDFLDTPYLLCKFGHATTRAIFISQQILECTCPSLTNALGLPEVPPKSVPLMVSNDGQNLVLAGTYVYHATPAITKMSPSIGPAHTKVTLNVKSSLGWVEELTCKFGDVTALGNKTSDHEIECEVPDGKVQQDGENPIVTVQISLNGKDYFGDYLTYQYSNQPLIYSLTPSHGPMSGHTEVVIHGKSFGFSSDEGSVLCRFGSVETIATLISTTKVTCIVPPQNNGTVSFSLISRRPDSFIDRYHGNKYHPLQYRYLPPIAISALSPTFGSIEGGTVLTIDVGEAPDVDNLYCVFGGKSATIAQVSSLRTYTCLTPPSNTSGMVSVGLAQDFEKHNMLTSVEAKFIYTAEPVINSIFPRRGPNAGGTTLTLQGNNFILPSDQKYVQCKIGNQTTPAVFISKEEIKCITPGDDVVREVQAIKITGKSASLQGSFTLGFEGDVTDPISVSSSNDEMREKLSSLPGIEDISVSTQSIFGSSPNESFLVTFLGLVNKDQPLLTVQDLLDDAIVSVERAQSLCCEVSLTLNGVDYHASDNGKPLVFVYDEKVAVTSISPAYGSVNGGTVVILTVSGVSSSTHLVNQPDTPLVCIFGSNEIYGHWINEETVSCSTPSSLWETKVPVGIKIGDIRSESMVMFSFHKDPIIISVFPQSLPAHRITTMSEVHNEVQTTIDGQESVAKTMPSIEVYGMHFHNVSMACIFDISLPTHDADLHRLHDVFRRPASYHNDTYIKCPDPPTVQSFFSATDLAWTTNVTLLEGATLDLSLETGTHQYFARTIPFDAVVKAISMFPRTGPRAAATEVVVEGANFVNSSALTCKFGPKIGSSAQYLSPAKVLCVSPHFPLGYGRVAVPVQIAVNGVDFSQASDDVLFEFHEPLVIKEIMPLIGLPKGGTIVNVTLDDTPMRLRAVAIQDRNDSVTVSGIDPAYGPSTGGNIVSVYGSGFAADRPTSCVFGGFATPANFISTEAIECIARHASSSIVDFALEIDGISVVTSQKYNYLSCVI